MHEHHTTPHSTKNTLLRAAARRWTWWGAAGIALVIGATILSCRDDRDTEDPDDEHGLLASEECGARRRLALQTGAQCEAGNGELLSTTGPLSAYCVYDRPEGVEGDDWGPDPERFEVIDDCPVYPQGSYPDNLMEYWWQSWTTKVGLVDESVMEGFDGKVTVAIIDTNPGDAHATMMKEIVRQVSNGCGGESCTRQIKIYSAMAGPDTTLTSEVATSIDNAVQAWHPSGTATPPGDLIISLSLAWQRPSVDAHLDPVYVALQHAACKGALVLVAAGNHSTHECTSGEPTEYFPAAWADEDQIQCDALANYTPNQREPLTLPAPTMSLTEPFVYAISAVDKEDRPLLSNWRSTQYATMGHQAVLPTNKTEALWEGPMSGTSVSTAVMAGIAAALWSKQKDFSASQIMADIWKSGEDNGVPATLVWGGGSPGQRVASVCAALHLEPCDTEIADTVVLDELRADKHIGKAEFSAMYPRNERPARGGLRLAREASAMFATTLSTVTRTACTATPDAFVHPQPNKYVCPPCYIDPTSVASSDASLHLQLSSDPTYVGLTPFSIKITLYHGAVEEPHWFTVDNSTEPAENTVRLISGSMHDYETPSLNYVTVGTEQLVPERAWIDVYFTTATGATKIVGQDLYIGTPPPT